MECYTEIWRRTRMKVKIKTRDIDCDKGRWEEYEWDDVHDEESAREKAQQLVDSFNRTLREGEVERVLEEVELIEGQRYAVHEHQWDKTSLVTEAGGYDRMKCEKCGITGKRYGVGQDGITRDDKYKKEVYARCDTATRYLRRHEIAKNKRERAHAKKIQFDRRKRK